MAQRIPSHLKSALMYRLRRTLLRDCSLHLAGCDWRELICFWYRRVIMKVRIICLLILCLPMVSTQFFAYGQTHRGSIRGSLVNSSGEALSNVAIKLVQTETNETRIAKTGDQGEFTVSSLPPGPYRIEVEQTGYKKYSRLATLQVNQALRLDISLEVGPISEELIVTAPETSLRKDSSVMGTVIENRQITSLPLDGRNFLELSLLVPGAVPAAQGS